MENELEKALEKKFFCPSKFAQDIEKLVLDNEDMSYICLLYTSPSPRDATLSRMPSSA